MDGTRYGLGVDLPAPYETAIVRLTEALTREGFDILTTIDVQATLQKKLDLTFRKYTILGACNPSLAAQALRAELEVGLLLPCNVIVYETADGRSRTAAIAPMTAFGFVAEEPELLNVAAKADERLRRVLASLEETTDGVGPDPTVV